MNKKIYYFLHDFNPDLDYSDGEIISLYPDVSYILDGKNISYMTPVEFYCEDNLFKDQDNYFAGCLDWITKFDKFLYDRISFCKENGLSLARINISDLKYFADELCIESYFIREFIKKAGRSIEIRYVRVFSAEKKELCPRTFIRDEKNNFLYDILEIVSQNNPVLTLKSLEFDIKKQPVQSKKALILRKDFLKAKSELLFKIVKALSYIVKYKKFNRFFTSEKREKILSLHLGLYQIDEILRGFIGKGFDVFTLSDDEILFLNGFLDNKVIDLSNKKNSNFLKNIHEECEKAAENICDSVELFKWVEEKCGLPVKPLIIPYLKHFVIKTCFEIICSTKKFLDFFNSRRIDRLVATSSAGKHVKGAILAAKILKIHTICFEHGIHAYFDKLITLTDLDPFDVYFTTDPLSQNMYADNKKLEFIKPCKVYQSSHYLSRIKSNYSKKNRGRPESKKKTILYVPTKVVSYRRSITVPTYAVDWYYTYQKKIIDYFASVKECNFIYKQPKTDWDMPDKSIIPSFNGKEKYSNISVETGRLSGYFSKVDGIILDRPTTSTFEAAVSGLPYLCLCADFVSYGLHDTFKNFFGKNLQIFSGYDEAIRCVKDFMQSPAEDYINELKLDEYDFNKVLSSVGLNDGVEEE